MLPSIKKTEGAKTKVLSKQAEKKQINIPWNSRLFFQIGLIVSLLLTFVIMESDITLGSPFVLEEERISKLSDEPLLAEVFVEPEFVPTPEIPKVTPPKVRQPITSVIEVVPDDAKIETPELGNTEVIPDAPLIGKAPVVVKLPKKNTGPKNPMAIEVAPTFPGCEGLVDNTARLDCLSSKIRTFIGRKFNTDKFSEKYAGETHRISVKFTIDAHGNIIDIMARAPGQDLEKEAKRVIAKLPQMNPGKQANQNVATFYSIPILYKSDY